MGVNASRDVSRDWLRVTGGSARGPACAVLTRRALLGPGPPAATAEAGAARGAGAGTGAATVLLLLVLSALLGAGRPAAGPTAAPARGAAAEGAAAGALAAGGAAACSTWARVRLRPPGGGAPQDVTMLEPLAGGAPGDFGPACPLPLAPAPRPGVLAAGVLAPLSG
jgi:hypothetical protein